MTPDPNPGGGTPAPTNPNPPANPPADPPPPKREPKPRRERTEEEQEEIDRLAEEKALAKLTAEREKDRAKAERDKAKAEEDAAKEQGKWKDLHEKSEAKAAAAELALRKEQIANRLRDHVAGSNPEYIAAAKYMLPLLAIEADTADADADKQIKDVVAQYVKDNPRAAKGGGGAPAAPSGGRLAAKPGNTNGNNQARRETSTASARF